ncbi:hypothetical protein PanWU01x14_104090 [Parasponia andersonii]|uniref:Transmembrane protein n=1 Tax=Parasponia andersonii TaxID=3476 RepID=A0A2P5D1Q6_PARAD|nr:hypothetical protein PanWU01x14_104090 [Parasponia andersonii]
MPMPGSRAIRVTLLTVRGSRMGPTGSFRLYTVVIVLILVLLFACALCFISLTALGVKGQKNVIKRRGISHRMSFKLLLISRQNFGHFLLEESRDLFVELYKCMSYARNYS